MPITQDWKIKSHTHQCAHTGNPFADDESFHTAIFTDPETGEFIRKDYSAEAWIALRGELDPFSFWRSTYISPPPPDAKPEVVEKESAEALLRRLIDDDEPHTENARYILALMLERKKLLRQTDTRFTDTAKLLIYEHNKSGDVFIVRDPELKLSEVDHVQTEVAALLSGDDQRDQNGEATESESDSPLSAPEK